MKLSARFCITLFNLMVSGLGWLFIVFALSNGAGNHVPDFGNTAQNLLSYLAYPMLAFVTMASSVALVASFIPRMAGRVAWRQGQTLLAWTLWGVAGYMVAGFLTTPTIGIGIFAWGTVISVFLGAAWLATECARYTRNILK